MIPILKKRKRKRCAYSGVLLWGLLAAQSAGGAGVAQSAKETEISGWNSLKPVFRVEGAQSARETEISGWSP